MPPLSPGLRSGSASSGSLGAPRSTALGTPLCGQARSLTEVEGLLAELGARVRRGGSLARDVAGAPPCCPTGIPRLDARLGGGFPLGRLSELSGAPSSGRTSLAMTLLGGVLARGALAAWIDPADAFDPASAGSAGGGGDALERLLWIRARTAPEALRCCERILQTEGFALTVLDLADTFQTAAQTTARTGARTDRAARPPAGAIRDASWLRLARLAAHGRSALVVLSDAPQTGSHAELVLELRSARARFSEPPALLDALETTAVLRRHRTRPPGPPIPLSLTADPEIPPHVPSSPPDAPAVRPDRRR